MSVGIFSVVDGVVSFMMVSSICDPGGQSCCFGQCSRVLRPGRPSLISFISDIIGFNQLSSFLLKVVSSCDLSIFVHGEVGSGVVSGDSRFDHLRVGLIRSVFGDVGGVGACGGVLLGIDEPKPESSVEGD